LLSEWAYQTRVPIAWISLDNGDNVRAQFWAYFRAALHTIPGIESTGVGDSLLNSLSSPTPPPVEEIFISLINELAGLPERIALVLDDLQTVTNSQVHDDLIYLLDHLPDNQGGLHLIVASRVDPPWPLARFRVRDDLMELREGDLRFSRDEVNQFLNQIMLLELSQNDVSVLDDRTEGWIAGLQMAAISLGKRRQSLGEAGVSEFIAGFSGSHQFVLDYLVEEVLNQQSLEVQEFLLRTSILERMNASLCDLVTGGDGSQAMLSQLDKGNLFLVPLDDNRLWYRYHHLFADLLKRRLEGSNADFLPTLHLRASGWFEGHDLLDEAVHHALAAADFDRAAILIGQHGMQMIVKGELVTLMRWLEALPEEQITDRPWLCIYHAWARYYIGPREKVTERLMDAERLLQSMQVNTAAESSTENLPLLSEAEIRHIRGHIAALRAYLDLQRGHLEHVSVLANQALEYLPEGDYARATSAIALAETYRASGDLAGWYRAYDQARSIALECQNLPMAVSAATYMGDQLAKQGKLHAAYESYQEALRLAVGRHGKHIPAAGLPYVKLGDLLREWNDLIKAGEYLEQGIKYCLEWGHSDSLVIGYVALSRLQLAEGDFENASETFAKAEQLVRQTAVDPWAVSLTDDDRLRLWLAVGNLSAAAHWIQESGLNIEDELNFYRDLEHINLARALVAVGSHNPSGPQLEKAQYLLDRLLKKASDAGWVGKSIGILNLQALAFRSLDQEDQALNVLEQALILAMPGDYARIFIDEGTPMAQLLYKAAARGITPDYAGNLLAEFGDLTPEDRVRRDKHHEELVEPLTKREIEVLQLIAQGLTNRQIGEALSISLGTVKRHTANINGKLGVRNRTQAAARARTLGIL
jgi:LuxR family maltose regulon positive regulatory protein